VELSVKNQNISILERKALSELQNNPKILIKPADKGGAVVVQNTKDYLTEAYRQLGDSSFYRQLPHNPVETFVEERDSILNRALEKQWITKKQFEFLKVEYPMTPVFYLLPKIHKRLVNPPGRPIVASKNSLSEPLSDPQTFKNTPGNDQARFEVNLKTLRRNALFPLNKVL
uniref:Uncharacterized protein n=1 Tax=Myripristis murdjan TaxID=586833 RepID=A0A667X0K7_9TELE